MNPPLGMNIEQLVEHYTPVIYDFIKGLPAVVKTREEIPERYKKGNDTPGLVLWEAPVQDVAGFESESGRQCEILTFEVSFTELDVQYCRMSPIPRMLGPYPFVIEEGKPWPKSYYELTLLTTYASFKRKIDYDPLRRVTWWYEFFESYEDRSDSVYISNYLDFVLRSCQAQNASNNYISPVLGVMKHEL